MVLAAFAVFASSLRPAAAQSSGTWEFGSSNIYFKRTVNSVGVPTDYIEQPIESAGSTLKSNPEFRAATDGTFSGTAASAGTMRIVGFWKPPYGNPNAPVPEKVTVRFSPDAYAQIRAGSTLTVDAVDVDSGFGDAAVYTITTDTTGSNYKRWTSTGKHLRTFAVTGATKKEGETRWKFELPLSLTSSASISASGSGYRSGMRITSLTAYAGGLGVQPDNRSVQIESGSFFDSAGKNWRKEGDQRLVNWRKGNGAQVVDAVADYEEGAGWWRGGATFTANKVGFTNPNPVYKWKVDGDQLATSAAWQLDRPTLDVSGGISRLIVANTPKITDTGINGNAQTLGATSNVSLDVTDTAPGDGAKGSNSFTVRWHLPVENWELDNTTAPIYTSVSGTTPNSGLVQEWTTRSTNVVGESIPVWVEPSPWQMRTLLSTGQQLAVSGTMAVGGGVITYYYAAATTVGAKFSLSTFAILTAAQSEVGLAQAKLDSCVNSPSQFATSVSSTQDSLRNVPNADARVFPTSWANDPNILSMQAQFTMTPYVKRTSKTFVFKGDEYDMTGYQGRATRYLDAVPQIEIIGEYEFTRQGTNE